MMQCRRLGPSEVSIAEICLGTMTWGEQISEPEAHEQPAFALSRGENFIDAAEMYPVPRGLQHGQLKQNIDSVEVSPDGGALAATGDMHPRYPYPAW